MLTNDTPQDGEADFLADVLRHHRQAGPEATEALRLRLVEAHEAGWNRHVLARIVHEALAALPVMH